MIRSFEEIIALWPSPEDLAADTGAGIEAVRKWKQRNSIPAEYWLGMVNASERRGFTLTLDDLAATAAQTPRARPQPSGAVA